MDRKRVEKVGITTNNSLGIITQFRPDLKNAAKLGQERRVGTMLHGKSWNHWQREEQSPWMAPLASRTAQQWQQQLLKCRCPQQRLCCRGSSPSQTAVPGKLGKCRSRAPRRSLNKQSSSCCCSAAEILERGHCLLALSS